MRAALAATSLDAAKGSFDGPHQNYQIDANDQITTSADYRNVVVAYRNGAPVILKDVAKRRRRDRERRAGGLDEHGAGRDREHPAAARGEHHRRRRTGSRRCCRRLRATIPSAIQITVLTDRTTTVRASVADVEFELMLCIALVVAVIFVFLRTFAGTLIPSVAVPLSLVGTFAAMYALGYSLNNLTLMALTISTGFVVDDAIVMIENISRYVEQGEEPLAAALKGAEQIGFTIMSLTVSLIAVLIPLLFMGDITGRLFREFAVTLSVTILISAAVSLTLTPMLCARLLRHRKPSEQSRLLPGLGAGLRPGPRLLRAHARVGPAPPGPDPRRGRGHPRPHGRPLRGRSPRASFRCRTRARSRASPRPTRAFRSPRWPGCSSGWRRSSSRIRRWTACPPSSGSTARTRPSTAAGSRST